MPTCPVENSGDEAQYKVYAPRGNSNQEALVTMKCTRAEFMAQLRKIYLEWLPHHWIKCWCEHQRRLTYATFGYDEACISTDFSAVYDHKAWATKCCEQPHYSNMAVFVVTFSRLQDGKRALFTEVVRVISEAKGGTHFHNVSLRQIVDYLKTILSNLRRVYLFTDGCKGQYKGRKKFARMAEFPSLHNGIQIRHLFSASHHFKGPHDQYGKDAKALARAAERNKKRRLPTTFDWYDFCANEMASPMKRARSLREATNEMQASEKAVEAAKERETYVAALIEKHIAVRARLHVGGSGKVHLHLHAAKLPLSVRELKERAIRRTQEIEGLARRKARIQRVKQRRIVMQVTAEGDEVVPKNANQRLETSRDSSMDGHVLSAPVPLVILWLAWMWTERGSELWANLCSR